MTYPCVIDEWTTLELLEQGHSIARYGDGELNLCIGGKAKSQPYEPALAKRLRQILRAKSPCLVGIPRLEDSPGWMPAQKQQFWAKYRQNPYLELYRYDKGYASAFITRPDSVPAINTLEYFQRLQRLWGGRQVVLINGEQPGQRFDEYPQFCSAAERWTTASSNAWAGYWELLQRCLHRSRETLFLLSIGPTATVLAFDLCLQGYQALDLGHAGMFAKRFYEQVDFSDSGVLRQSPDAASPDGSVEKVASASD